MERQPYFQTMEKFLVHETAIHLIDVFRFLLKEEPSAVYAALRRLNPAIKGEDAGMMLFDFPSGARAVFDGSCFRSFISLVKSCGANGAAHAPQPNSNECEIVSVCARARARMCE